MYVLIIDSSDDYDLPDVHGPFETIELAQSYAEKWRESQGLPGPATPANNDLWTERGWIFAIVEPFITPGLVRED